MWRMCRRNCWARGCIAEGWFLARSRRWWGRWRAERRSRWRAYWRAGHAAETERIEVAGIQRQVGEVAGGAFLHGRHGNLVGVDALGGARALVIGEEENFVFADGAADGAAELVLIEGAAGGRKVVARVEIGIAQECEEIAVKGVGAGFGDDVDLAAAELAILGVEITGEDAKLG